MLDFVRRDVIFLHAPSVYDFRKDTILFGPISDVVPSSSVFEMYPVGITSIADRLERAGYHVQVVNVAYRMLRDPAYDPESEIRRLQPRLWAIDLHWLPHAHGALALAELIKKHHPDARVLMGGLSASYYHQELIENPNVDFVLRGDSTEEPVLELLRRLRTDAPLDSVPNLTWKRRDGHVVNNPLSHVPESMDGADVPAYRYMMRSVFKYWNLQNIVPYLRWLEYPMTALLTARGCTQHCSICGGSKASYKLICNRSRPAVRSPERMAKDVRFIRRFSRAPIFVIHDLRMHGAEYAQRFFRLLRQQRVENEIVFELFAPADGAYFDELRSAAPHYSLEMTLESHDEELRRLNGKFPVSNEQVESTIEAALAHGCHRLDVYFMVGIPKQTSESALASMEYARGLLDRFGRDGRLQIYVAPLAPFLDPGSPAFEEPEKYGYRLRARTLEEHRQRLTSRTWGQILNYESLTMDPDTLVETTYEATARLTRIKAEFGLVTPAFAERTLGLIETARSLLRQMAQADRLPEPDRAEAIARLHREAAAVNGKRIYDQLDFVSWGGRRLQLRPLGLAVLMVELFFEELSLAWLRYSRRLFVWKEQRRPEAAHAHGTSD
jgi:B12-binding domain/radical SAM domain protein